MNKILEKWKSLSASSGIVRFLDINLRSIGQVMLQNNPLTGLFFWPRSPGVHTQPASPEWRLPASSRSSWQT